MKSSLTKATKPPAGKKSATMHKHRNRSQKPTLGPRKLTFIYLSCIVISSILAGLMATHQHSQKLADPFSAEQRNAVSFKLYYPSRLPKPFYVDTAPLSRLQQSVVVIRITNGAGKGQVFTLSQQALPSQTNLEAFYQSFGDRTTFKTSAGKAVTGTIDDGATRLVSIVTADNTWILVQASTIVSLQTLQESLSSLAISR